jgi:uncharacterized integral membrane protein
MRREHDEGRPAQQPPVSDEGVVPGTAGARDTEDEHLDALRRARQARVAKAVSILAIVVILMIFIIANAKAVPVSFVFFHRMPPLIWVMFACAVLGGIAGYLIGKPGRQVRLHRKPGEEKRAP